MSLKTKQFLSLNYERYVRLFILLLLAFFFLAHIGTSYLLNQAKNRLKGEQEIRLLLLSQAAAEILKPALSAEDNDAENHAEHYTPGTSTFMLLEDLRIKGNLYALLCWDLKGRIFFSSFSAPPSSPPKAWEELSEEIRASILRGNPYVSDFIKTREGLILRTGYFPLTDRKGQVEGVVYAGEESRFLRTVEKFSPWVQSFILLGMLSLLVLSALFLQEVLKPYRQLTSAAREAGRLPSLKESEASSAESAVPQDEVEVIIKTFQEMIASLKAQEVELRELHAQAQERADRFETLYRYIMESMTSGVVGFDPQARISVINPWAQRLLKLEPEKTLGRPCKEVFGLAYESLLNSSLTKGLAHFRKELPYGRDQEPSLWLGLSAMPMRDPQGKIVGAAFLLTDLTEVKRLQQELKIKERFAAIGELSGGMAHELRNSIGAISGFSQLLSRKLTAEDPLKAHIEDIRKEVVFLEKLTNDFLSFARPIEPQYQPLNLENLLEDALKSLPLSWEEKKIRIVTGGSLSTFTVKADPFWLRQALANLLLNAYQALEQGGEVTLEARRSHELPGTPLRREAGVVLSVKDNGPGIAADYRSKLFMPFFTTKKEGLGLGLAITKKIMLAHGGDIEVRSEEGKGTEFLLYLTEMS